MDKILTDNWHLDPPSRLSLQKGRGQEAYCDTDSWRTGERAFCFCAKNVLHFALKSCYILGQKLLQFALMLNFVAQHLSLTPVFLELLLIILNVLHFWMQLIFYIWRPNPRAYAQVGGVGDLHGWCIYLRSLTPVTLHVIGPNPLINEFNPITIGHVSYLWQNVVVTTMQIPVHKRD